MPELPEVETICRGLKSAILNKKIIDVYVSSYKLRYPIPKNLAKILKGQAFRKVSRRGKYILLDAKTGTLIIHLGMSGTLQIRKQDRAAAKHEHMKVIFANNLSLCYTDPRRFGAILWITTDPLKHRSLKKLGLEPLAKNFTADFLFKRAKTKKCSIKQLIMDNGVVTGIGNIYASEVLFAAKINPLKKAHAVSFVQHKKLVKETKKILTLAIKYGGTTIKDHTDSSGNKGSFQNKLKVYGRSDQPCVICQTKLVVSRISGRSTVSCPFCQR